jgi:hypothetical protein
MFTAPDRSETFRAYSRPVVAFGAGLRPCPGDRTSIALAAGAVEAASHCKLVDIVYGPPGKLRVPIRLEVIA